MNKIWIVLSFLSVMCIVAAYDFRITNKTGRYLNVHVYHPGRTYINVRPKDDHVSHEAPLVIKLLKPGEVFDFSTKGLNCIGAIEAFGNLSSVLLDKGKRGRIRCTYPNGSEGGQCDFINSKKHCGLLGFRKKWKIVEKNGKLDLQND